MPRYEFARPARAALLDQLLAAGVTPGAVEMDDARCWVTCAPEEYERAAAVVAAHDAAALDAAETRAAGDDDDDRDAARALIQVLLDDAARLADTSQAMTLQQVRNHLARADKALATALRILRRRGVL